MAKSVGVETRSGPDTVKPASRERGRRFLEEYRVELAMLGALVLLCVVLSVLSPNFLTAGNLATSSGRSPPSASSPSGRRS